MLFRSKAVKYSERFETEEVSYRSLMKALKEMKIDLPVTEKDVRKIQRPERILSQYLSIGSPSVKRVRENLVSLREKMKKSRAWLNLQGKRIQKAKEFVERLEKQIKS